MSRGSVLELDTILIAALPLSLSWTSVMSMHVVDGLRVVAYSPTAGLIPNLWHLFPLENYRCEFLSAIAQNFALTDDK